MTNTSKLIDLNNFKPKSKFLTKLLDRGIYDNCNDFRQIDSIILNNPNKIIPYIGFDLTADGLHVGHLSTLMCIKRFMQNGHKCIIVLGGGTTRIGDPTGKSETRKILSTDEINVNKNGICSDIMQILLPKLSAQKKAITLNKEIVFENNNLLIVDNNFWLLQLNYIDFLRDIGCYFSVNKLVKMDTMSTRLNQDQPLSFIEFNYPLLQAYDFLYLNKKYNCNCQIGGSDQWGNMLRGVELIHKEQRKQVFCLTTSLIVRSDGKKMGKSENGAIWINKNKLDDISYWQYFRNVDDKDVQFFTKIFTQLDIEEITKSTSDINEQKERLATEATKICRGEENAIKARNAIKGMLQGKIDVSIAIELKNGISIVEALIQTQLASSKNEARRLISSKGVKLNSNTVENEKFILTTSNIAQFGHQNKNPITTNQTTEFAVISCGKKRHKTIKLIQ